MKDKFNAILEGVYENYIIRDMVYIVGGFIFTTIIIYTFGFNIIYVLDIVSKNIFVFLISVSISYFIGFYLRMLSGFILQPGKQIDTELEKQFMLHECDLINKYGKNASRKIERMLIFRNIGLTFFVISGIGLLLIGIHFILFRVLMDLVFIVFLFAIGDLSDYLVQQSQLTIEKMYRLYLDNI